MAAGRSDTFVQTIEISLAPADFDDHPVEFGSLSGKNIVVPTQAFNDIAGTLTLNEKKAIYGVDTSIFGESGGTIVDAKAWEESIDLLKSAGVEASAWEGFSEIAARHASHGANFS